MLVKKPGITSKKAIATGIVLTTAFSTVGVSIALLFPNSALAAKFNLDKIDQIYTFGDSLSDTGNFFQQTGFPPSPYFQGRFSNGSVWIEYLTQSLGLPAIAQSNFAFGGATTGTDNTVIPGFPGLQTEIGGFLASNPPVNPNALYVVWAGANDYLGGGVTNPNEPVDRLATAINSLAGFGAQNILVVNLPDLGQLPGTKNTPFETPLDILSSAHNFGLANKINQLQTTLGSDVNLISFDVNSLFRQAINNPQDFGFTNVTDSCLVGVTVCSKPNEYLFWDDIHPTTVGHQAIANSAYETLQAASVPEPTFIVGTLSFGAYLAYSKKRQTKAKAKATANT
ncbi:SGNH/GDSL hydrolase family protein [Merismopedia glauca]|uniref:GDSL family lipase n=1 Tax=Merismopedia glauca CCAP 1448/3 TaxID=1296344 RepID=A0A2T1C1B4_9CYAN|nr:SGNH/GDSL hydrolase family protein [Merismopedia glauca]PSB02032.1 GDSL family lipase [Merismopedia glauca CCAP 1448/3]